MDYTFYGKVTTDADTIKLEVELPLESDSMMVLNGNGVCVPCTIATVPGEPYPAMRVVKAEFTVKEGHFFLIGESTEFTEPVKARFHLEQGEVIADEEVMLLQGTRFQI